jgi:hypothetical protein
MDDSMRADGLPCICEFKAWTYISLLVITPVAASTMSFCTS